MPPRSGTVQGVSNNFKSSFGLNCNVPNANGLAIGANRRGAADGYVRADTDGSGKPDDFLHRISVEDQLALHIHVS
jgi:hypothetical protein